MTEYAKNFQPETGSDGELELHQLGDRPLHTKSLRSPYMVLLLLVMMGYP